MVELERPTVNLPPLPLSRPPGVPQRRPVHPGRFLQRHYLEPMRLSQSEAARRLGISRRRVNELVMGHRAMSPDTAIRCAIAFGLPASKWLALQAEFDCWQAWQELRQATQTPEGRSATALPESLIASPAAAPRDVRAPA